MNKLAYKLGYLGLIPFIGLSLTNYVNPLYTDFVNNAFAQYSAIILSFLAGVHWYPSLNNENDPRHMNLSMLPSIVGWLSISTLPVNIAIIILAISHGLWLVYDGIKLSELKGYMVLRMQLTGIAVMCHVLILNAQ